MWFEIFKTGTWTDAQGKTRDWTDSDIDTIVAKYDPTDPAPIVIGHPADNAPAFGWVDALKRRGNVLLAKAKDIAPEFAEMVRRGLFKKRSMSVYPDMRLRHVGFLGAMPPAVKGLADVQFSGRGYGGSALDYMSSAEGCVFSDAESAGHLIETFIKQRMKESPALSYSEAFTEVQVDHPDIAREYVAEMQVNRR